MPRTYGESGIHISKIPAVVETDRPLFGLPAQAPSEVQRRIAANVARLIPDGAYVQTGIGGIPDAVLNCLGGHKDLGVHSEMCSDGVIDLIESGVLTGARKNLHRGKIVIGFAFGTRRLFDFMNENPIFELRPTHYTNDPFVIARNERMIAINSAIEVDLNRAGLRRLHRRPAGNIAMLGALLEATGTLDPACVESALERFVEAGAWLELDRKALASGREAARSLLEVRQ